MGGLIARKYLLNEIKINRKINIRKLLLFATPNQGSQIAKLSWLSRIAHVSQMKKNSDFIDQLNEDWGITNVEKYVQVQFIAGGKDRWVDRKSATNYLKINDIKILVTKGHSNIVKPIDKNDESYLALRAFILQRFKFLLEDYKKPLIYIPRRIIKVTDYNDFNVFYIKDKLQLTLFESIIKYGKVTLLAGAGEGKTTELDFMAWLSYSSNLMIYPVKIRLKDYTGGNIEEIFPVGWELIPTEQLMLVLDGFDEIESPNIKSAKRSIEHFSEQYPETKILITCRTNFYQTPSENFSGTIKGFEPFYLLKLDQDKIENFVSSQLKNKAEYFYEQVNQNKLREIISIPFYLTNLINYFKLKSILPTNIVSMFSWLVEIRLSGDIEHFRTTQELENKRNTVNDLIE